MGSRSRTLYAFLLSATYFFHLASYSYRVPPIEISSEIFERWQQLGDIVSAFLTRTYLTFSSNVPCDDMFEYVHQAKQKVYGDWFTA